jgi:tight adherence protein B
MQLLLVIDVSERTGAVLADPLTRLAAGLRAEQEAAVERAGALAGPAVTARLLTALPVVGLAFGGLLGLRPVHILTGTAPGRSALLAGCALWLAGRVWTRRLVRRASAG